MVNENNNDAVDNSEGGDDEQSEQVGGELGNCAGPWQHPANRAQENRQCQKDRNTLT